MMGGGCQRQRKNTYQVNQEDTLEENDGREEVPSEGEVDTENSGRERVTFHKYWLHQIIDAGIKPQDSIQPKFGAFAQYVADEFTPDDF